MSHASQGFVRRLLAVVFTLGVAGMLGQSCQGSGDYVWNVDGSGNWNVSTNWAPTGDPNAADENVFIRNTLTASNPVVVSLAVNLGRNVGNLTVDADGSTVHELSLLNNTYLNVYGDVTNDGIISLNATANATQLQAAGSDATLGGDGRLVLGSGANYLGATGDFTWTNGASHTIEGGGNLGVGSARIINYGLIDANLSAVAMTLDPRNAGGVMFTNYGTARASGGGTLLISGGYGGEFGGTGTIQALAGSEVVLVSNAVVYGNMFTTAGDGLIRVAPNHAASLASSTNSGQFQVGNNADLQISGTITNSGEFRLTPTVNASRLLLSANVALGGAGEITLEALEGGSAQIGAHGDFTLTNVDNTIQGYGNIGIGLARIVNQGLIDANVSGTTLTIDPRNIAEATFTNETTAQASGGGTLQLTGAYGGYFDGAGIYQALGGSEVLLTSSAVIYDSTFATAGDGLVRVSDNQTVYFANVTNTGRLQVGNNADLRWSGSFTNTSGITLSPTANSSRIVVDTDITLSGGGTVTLNGSGAHITASGDFTLVNQDNVIQGEGNIGAGGARIVNRGQIDANVNGGVLTLDPRNMAEVTFTNESTAQASGGGILVLSGAYGGEFGGSGTYRALNGSEVLLAGAAVHDSTFTSQGTGQVRVSDNYSVHLLNCVNDGQLRVANNADLWLYGILTNTGEITLAPTVNASRLVPGADVTLTGGGTVTFSGDAAQLSAGGDFTFTNVDNTIQGYGNVGAGAARIVNQGLIDANASGRTLTLDPRNIGTVTFTNESLARASGGGQLNLTGAYGGEFDGTGTYQALDGSQVILTTNATVRDSIFTTAGSGLVRVPDNQAAHFVDVTNNGQLQVDNNADLYMYGTLSNTGTVTLLPVANTSRIVLGDHLTLTGGGTWMLLGSAAHVTSAVDATLTNVDHTIQGYGNIGAGAARVVNHGLIDASVSGETLTIDPRNIAEVTFINELTGIVQARNGATLMLDGSYGGEFSNRNGGRIAVESVVRLANTAVLRNEPGGRIDGTGVIDIVNGFFSNSGVVAPGFSTGILTVQGAYSQNADGVLEMELGGLVPGDGHDQLVVTQLAGLAGVLDLSTSGSVDDPTYRGQQDQFVVLTAGNIDGSFDTVVYDDVTLIPTFTGSNGSFATLIGPNQNGDDGLFRRVDYTSTDVTVTNYLALPGDANGDGNVDVSDFNIWNENKFTGGTNWSTADFNTDGLTDVSDFNIWNENKFTSVGGPQMVAEPTGGLLSMAVLIVALAVRRRQF